MPMASWGGGTDPSSLFAQIASSVADQVRVQAERFDARRESELAGQDKEMFARYQAGDITDDQWLDYIRRRRSETDYDPEQQAAWTKAELEWSEKIEDDRAATAFANTGDYGEYIGYLRQKLAGTKDSDGRLAITQQIRSLQDERATKAFARGEQRIVDRIALKKATQDDLLAFYREQRSGLREGSPLRDTVNSRIRQTQAVIAQQRFEDGMARIDTALAGNHITPKEAARQKQALLNGSALQQTDPSRYWQIVGDIDRLRHSPDPAELAKLQYRLSNNELSPDEYIAAVNRISDRLMDFDPTTAWQLRTQALADATQKRAQIAKDTIPFPEYLGRGSDGSITLGPKGSGGDFRWIAQMDGTAYAATNCTMASGAMLAYAMGYKGLSGGDLRYLTGDTVGGTNLDQMMLALGKAGVDTSGMNQFVGGAFEKFKQAVGNGRPAVLMGSNANLPEAARAAAGHTGRHALLIAEYDAKKDAFLVYNSAVGRGDKRSKNGYWVAAGAIENFGWGGGLSAPGQFVLSPKGTITPGKRKALHVIDVNTPPQQPGTPESYVGRTNPGASGNQRGAARATKVVRDPPANMTELKEREAEAERRLDTIDEMVDAYTRGKEFDGAMLTPEVIQQLDRETLTIIDEEIALAQAAGDSGHAMTLRDRRRSYIKGVKERSGAGVTYLLNTMIRDAREDIAELTRITDIDERNRRVGRIAEQFRNFADARTGGDGDLAGVDPDTDTLVNGVADLMGVAADPNIPQDQKAKTIKDMVDGLGGTLPADFTNATGLTQEGRATGDDIGWLAANAAGMAEDKNRIDNETGTPIVIGGVYTTVPYRNEKRNVPILDPETGQPTGQSEVVDVAVPDTTGIGDGTPGDQLPKVVVQTGDGPVLVPAVVTQQPNGTILMVGGKDITLRNGTKWESGRKLTSADIAALGSAERRELIANKELVEQPWMVDTIVTPDRQVPSGGGVFAGTIAPGSVWAHEPGRPMQEGWHRERLPITTSVVGDEPGASQYIGWDEDTDQPDINYIEGANGQEFPVAGGVDGMSVQRKINSGEWEQYRTPADQRQYRDDTGNLTPDRTWDDSGTAYAGISAGQRWLNEIRTADDFRLQDEIRREQTLKRAEAAKAAAEVAQRAASAAGTQTVRQGWVAGLAGFLGEDAPKQVMDLAEQFGITTPRKQPPPAVTDTRNVPVPERKPPPAVGSKAPSVPKRTSPPPVSRTAPPPPIRQEPRKTKRFIPPPPPKVTAIQRAKANQAAATAKAAAEAAKRASAAATAARSGGIFGGRRAV